MNEVRCAGLPASWLNGWLAAVGATVLSPDLRLRWTGDGTPRAVLCAETEDPVAVLASSWPSRAVLKGMPIRRRWPNLEDLPRQVPVDAFRARAAALRGDPLSWALSSTVTDLHVDENGNVAHGPFDPPVPRGYVVHDRLMRLQSDPSRENLCRTLEGTGERIDGNGLGFDLARIGSEADGSPKSIDPVVETLAFFGLALLPVRGTGTDARMGRRVRPSTTQRGWVWSGERRPQARFIWPAWRLPLDCAAIDALLDLWQADGKGAWSALGIQAAWRSVSYEGKGISDPTRGFGAERLG